MSAQGDPYWKQVHDEATIVDLHAHPSLKASLFRRVLTQSTRTSRAFNPLNVRTDFPKLKKGGVDVLLSTVYAPEKGIYHECIYLRILRLLMPLTWKRLWSRPSFDVTMAMLDTMEDQVRKAVDPATGRPMAQLVQSVSELDRLLATDGERPVAVIHNVEGGHSLSGSLANLDRLFERGIAYLTLAHFYPNEAVNPTFPYPESVQKFGCFKGDRDLTLGLTEFGEQVVERMVELGMILDIAHCTPPARRRIYDIVGSRAPLIASHVGAYEINPSPYNLQDWELKKVADSGGLAGVILMNYWLMPHETKRGLNFVTSTLVHFCRVAGVEHVGIGTDFDGFTDPPDDLRDAGELGRLTQRLVADGWGAEEIQKIWGGNALRVLHQGWGRR